VYVAKINDDLYLRKVVENEIIFDKPQVIHYKLTNIFDEAKHLDMIDDGDPFVDNLKKYGFKFYRLDEVEVE